MGGPLHRGPRLGPASQDRACLQHQGETLHGRHQVTKRALIPTSALQGRSVQADLGKPDREGRLVPGQGGDLESERLQ